MNAELVVKAIVEIGRADEATLPSALQQLADSLNYKHAAIVEAQKSGLVWVPRRTVCKSREFRRACRSVLSLVCESAEPVRMFAIADSSDLTQSVLETDTYAAAGIHLKELCTADRKTVLLLVTDDRTTSLSEMEQTLLATVGTLVCKGLSGQELDVTVPEDPGKIGDAIGIVSHDLRNPVGTILGYTEILLASKGAPAMLDDQRMAISKIRDNSLFILHLLGDLLESAQIDSGRVKLEAHPWDVGSAIYNSVDRCRMLAEKKAITLEISLESPGIRAMMDHHKVGQVLDNLITNAIKFSRTGTRVRAGARAQPPCAEIWVEDEGQGIPEAEVSNLFKKFSRTTTRGTAGEKSTGLGLYIVSELVRLHGGTVRVDTVLDHGSTFTFTLPLAPTS